MKFLIGCMIFVACWSATAETELRISFQLKKMADRGPEYSAAWDPHSQEALIRMVLVPLSTDNPLKEMPFNLGSAVEVELSIPRDSSLLKKCSMVPRWSFNYTPELPDYLMYVVLKGEGCEKVARKVPSLQTQWKFKGISDAFFLPQDIVIDVQP